MNPLYLLFIAIALMAWTCSSGSGNSSSTTVQREVASVIVEESASDGLDLKRLPDIVSQATNAGHLESLLNEPNGINNLDIDADGVTDYINVTEYGDTNSEIYGFSLLVKVAETEEQEIASVEIQKQGEQVNVGVQGNQQMYGSSASYGSSFPLGSFLLMSYLLSPHPFFYSPFGYRAYPPGYSTFSARDNRSYQNDVSRYNQSARNTTQSKLKSPNSGKVAQSGIKKKLSNPTSSQRSFRSSSLTSSKSSTASKSRFGGFGKTSGARNFGSSSRSFGGFGK